MPEIPKRFNSSRLWFVLGFLLMLPLNAMLGMGLENVPENGTLSPLSMGMFTVVTYVFGNSYRGTVVGGILEQGLAIGTAALVKVVPRVGDPERIPTDEGDPPVPTT